MNVVTLGAHRSRVLARRAMALACVVMLIAADLVAVAGSRGGGDGGRRK